MVVVVDVVVIDFVVIGIVLVDSFVLAVVFMVVVLVVENVVVEVVVVLVVNCVGAFVLAFLSFTVGMVFGITFSALVVVDRVVVCRILATGRILVVVVGVEVVVD